MEYTAPACLGRTMELLWNSVFLGGDRGRDSKPTCGRSAPQIHPEELAEFLRQAHKLDLSLTEARSRLVDIDTYRIDMLTFMADRDVIVGPAMPTPAKPHHHGLVEISDFSHMMAHNLDRVARRGRTLRNLPRQLPVGVQVVARPWQDATALAVAAHLENVFGGWQPPASDVGQGGRCRLGQGT